MSPTLISKVNNWKLKRTAKPRKILVTGAAGFMGSHLVDYLLAEGHRVYGVDDLSGGYLRNVNPRCRFTKLDLFYQDSVRIYIEHIKPEIIYHLAADATEGRSQFTPINCSQRNYMAYLNLLIPAIRAGFEKMVLTSSMSVYGAQRPPFSEEMEAKPEDIYGTNKAAMEKTTQILSEVHGFRYTILRPHNVFGPRQNLADPYRNVIGIFINCLLNNRNFYIYGDGEQKRSFSYIDDLTPCLARAGFAKSSDYEIINIGPREEISINKLAGEVLSHFVEDPKNPPAHLKPEHLPNRPKEVKNAFCTEDKARRLLGYSTKVNLAEGISKMVRWARKLGPQKFIFLEELEITSPSAPKTWTHKLLRKI